MPGGRSHTHRHAADGNAESAQPTGEHVEDDVQVVWRKKSSPHPVAATPDVPTGEESGDWQERFQEEQAKAEDYLAKWQRAAADMSNMRRRHEQERMEFMRQANAALIAELLPVLDSFDRALESMPDEVREAAWADGMQRVERQLRTVLERAGLSAIEASGKPFDPNEHEAIMREASDQPEGTVTGELQRGYKLHDRVLRPSMVKVASNE